MQTREPCRGVLVVEDDRDIRESLKLVLEMEGFHVSAATNGREALDMLERLDRPCVILLDLMMPVMNGWEFLQHMQSDTVIATIPVVVVSAIAERARARPIAAYVKKPVDINVLIQLVERYCPREHRAA